MLTVDAEMPQLASEKNPPCDELEVNVTGVAAVAGEGFPRESCSWTTMAAEQLPAEGEVADPAFNVCDGLTNASCAGVAGLMVSVWFAVRVPAVVVTIVTVICELPDLVSLNQKLALL